MRLGLVSFGEKEEPDLPAARHAIDMLAMLEDKTKGNLSMEEQRLIENSLTEVRFRFVQVFESAANVSPAEASTPPAATPPAEATPADLPPQE